MLTLANVACGTDYTAAATLGPEPNATGISVTLIPDTSSPGASGIMQVAPLGFPGQDWGPEIPLTSTVGLPISKAAGVRFRNAVAGQIVRVSATLSQPADPNIGGGTPFSGTISGTGQVTTGMGVIDYAERTTPVPVTATTENSAQTIVGGQPVVYNGSSIVLVEFFCPSWDIVTVANNVSIIFQDETGVLGTVFFGRALGSGTPSPGIYGRMRLTPSAGTHTYSARAWLSGATTATFEGGAGGGGGAKAPISLRVSADS